MVGLPETYRGSWRRFNGKLYLALLLTGLLPTLYTTLRIRFLGDLPAEWGVNVASQLAWVGLLFEVVQEALLLPLFYLLGKTLTSREETANRVRTGLAVTFGLYAALSALVAIFAGPLVAAMAQDPRSLDATVSYIRWEMLSAPLGALVRFFLILFVLLDWRRHIYAVLGLQMATSMLFDTLFLSKLDVSLDLGVNGIAYSNAIASAVTLAYAVWAFRRDHAAPLVGPMRFGWMAEWWRVGKYAGIDSLVRNAFYLVFIVRMMNVVSEQGTYWVANGFIWGWLLLPLFPLAELVKRDAAAQERLDHKEKLFPYLALGMGLVAVWALTIPFWDAFLGGVMNVPEPGKVRSLALTLLPFYALFVLNTILDAVLVGKGRTELLALQSIVTNVLVYGTAYVLFALGVFTPTLKGIALLFGTGILVDTVVTWALYSRYVRREGYRI